MFDPGAWDDIRIIRWLILPVIAVALASFWPHFIERNANVAARGRGETIAGFADNHCLDTPGPHHFILCRQRITFTTDDDRSVSAAVTVTQQVFEDHIGGALPIYFDKTRPQRVSPVDAPRLGWFFLDGLVKIAVRAVPATFAAFFLGFLLARVLRLPSRFGQLPAAGTPT